MARTKSEMTLLAQELKKLGVPLTLVVYPWPQQEKRGPNTTSMRIRVSSCGSFSKSFWAESAICGQAEGLKIPAETWEAAVEGKALAGFPAGEFGDPIFQRKPQSQFQRGKPDARRQGLGVELLTKKDI